VSIRLIAAGAALLSLVAACRANGCAERPALKPPVAQGQFKVASTFGLRRNPISGHITFHAGIDLWGRPSAAVFNMLDGRVVGLEPDANGAVTITVEHCGGWVSEYRHVVDPIVAVGQMTPRGARLASIGRLAESSRGARIHVSLSLNGRPIDPLPLFANAARHRE
jgi:murein DD-endopeptidase MepM/ murein hydrolase activator NlpD